jgi:hypothetical protein
MIVVGIAFILMGLVTLLNRRRAAAWRYEGFRKLRWSDRFFDTSKEAARFNAVFAGVGMIVIGCVSILMGLVR